MNKWVTVAISAGITFVITAGTGYTVAAAAGTGAVIPPTAQIIVLCIGGLIAAAKDVQATLSSPPA